MNRINQCATSISLSINQQVSYVEVIACSIFDEMVAHAHPFTSVFEVKKV